MHDKPGKPRAIEAGGGFSTGIFVPCPDKLPGISDNFFAEVAFGMGGGGRVLFRSQLPFDDRAPGQRETNYNKQQDLKGGVPMDNRPVLGHFCVGHESKDFDLNIKK